MESLEKTNTDYQSQLNDWIKQEKAAIDLISAVGKLWFEKSIELILFRNQLVDRSASEIMNLHLYAKNIVNVNAQQNMLVTKPSYFYVAYCANTKKTNYQINEYAQT